ncbi:MAG: peptidylprolyl isomerase [Rhodospirillales bacterium]|nr:peptidylprolyl isomerase [Rhodospirillales bacterium]
MKRLFSYAVTTIALVSGLVASAQLSPGVAQNTLRAAAVVNDEVISMLDLAMRTRLAILASGLNDSPEARSRLQRQVLRSLIDERLQLQEAKRLEITVDEGQTEDTISMLAQQNNMSREQFFTLLRSNEILPKALLDQVRSELTWRRLVQRRLRPTVDIGEEEIDEVITRIQSSQGRIQLRVSEILLGVDSVLQDDDVRRTAERLVEQLRGGANFAALARQFSQSATASVGGDLGWVEEGQLPDELTDQLGRMRPGEMAGPISTFGGFYILLLRDRRQVPLSDATVNIKQLLFALPPDAAADQLAQARTKAAELQPRIEGCESFDALAKEHGSPGSGDLGTLSLSELPEDLRRVIWPLPVGQASAPIRVAAGISLLLVCSREDDGIDREKIRDSLTAQRLDMLARRYLRDLRRAATVDIRL